MIKKKKILSLMILIIPLLLVIVGFSAWIISTTHKIAPSYTPNHTLADYFVENDVTTYNTQEQYPSIESTMSSNDSFNEENFVNSLYFSYAEVYEDNGFVGDGTYTEGKPTNAGRYSIRVAFTSTDADEDVYYDYLTINKATLTVDTNNVIAPVYPNSKSYVTTQNTLSQVTLQGKVIHEINDENIENLSFDISATGTYEITGSASFSVGIESYNYTYTLNNNYNPLTGTINIETYAIVSLNKSLSSEQGSSYKTSIEVKGGSTYASIKTQVSTAITNNGLDTDLPGYTYKGVSVSDASYIAVTDDLVISANKTLFAHHELDIYDITYFLNCDDASWSSTASVTYTYIDNTYTIPSLTRPNYTFIGWIETDSNGNALSADASPNKSMQIPGGSEGDKYFKAYWGFTVDFYDANKNKIHTEEVVENGTLKSIPDLGITDTYSHTFVTAWTDGDGGSEISGLSTLIITEHMSIYAKVTSTARQYNVNVYYKDRDNQVSQILYYETKADTTNDTWIYNTDNNHDKQVYDFTQHHNTTGISATYGSGNIQVGKQIRVAHSYSETRAQYDNDKKTLIKNTEGNYVGDTTVTRYIHAFYKSEIQTFTWAMLDAKYKDGKTDAQVLDTHKVSVNLSADYKTLTIVVSCKQPTAIITSKNVAVTDSSAVYYHNINDAFNGTNGTGKTIRVYGQMHTDIYNNAYSCFNPDDGTTITLGQSEFTVAGTTVKLNWPSYSYNVQSMYTLNNSNNAYTIASGDMVILPYGREDATTVGYLDKQENPTNIYGSTVQSILIIPSGFTLNVSGIFNIGGFVVSTGTVTQRGVVMNNGTINVNSSIRAYGNLKGTGVVELGKTNTGASIIDVFRMHDWPGGANALGIWGDSYYTMFPVQVYSLHNVSCKTVVYYGSYLKALTQVAMNGGNDAFPLYKDIVFLGSGGLFQMNGTGGKITREVKNINYSGNAPVNTSYTTSNQDVKDKEVYDIEASVIDNTISIVISAQLVGEVPIETGSTLPLPIGNMEINFLSGNSTLSANSYNLLPGAVVYVAPSARLNLSNASASITMMNDYVDNYTYTDPSGAVTTKSPYAYYNLHSEMYNGTTIKDQYKVKFVVDGTLISSCAFSGEITSNGGGNITLSKNTSTYKKINTLKYSSNDGYNILEPYQTMGSITTFTNSSTLYAKGTISGQTNKTFSTGVKYTHFNGSWGTDVTISYVSNGGYLSNGSLFNTEQLVVGGGSNGISMNETYAPTLNKPFYTFNGWYLDSAFTTPVPSSINTNQTLYAKFTPNTYNLNYSYVIENDAALTITNPNSANTTFNASQIYDLEDATIPENQQQQGYIFAGWYYDEACSKPIAGNEFNGSIAAQNMVDNTTTLYGKWILGYVITVDYNDPYGLYTNKNYVNIFSSLDEISTAIYPTATDGYTTFVNGTKTTPTMQYYFTENWYSTKIAAGGDTSGATSVTSFTDSLFSGSVRTVTIYGYWNSKYSVEWKNVGTGLSETISGTTKEWHMSGDIVTIPSSNANKQEDVTPYYFNGWTYDNGTDTSKPGSANDSITVKGNVVIKANYLRIVKISIQSLYAGTSIFGYVVGETEISATITGTYYIGNSVSSSTKFNVGTSSKITSRAAATSATVAFATETSTLTYTGTKQGGSPTTSLTNGSSTNKNAPDNGTITIGTGDITITVNK